MVPGDVRNVAADAWLLPGDLRPHLRAGWFVGRPALAQIVQDLAHDGGGLGLGGASRG
jgi:hypothetical protein